MKIAVCLFGHLRTYKYCCEALNKNLLNLYDCDVFMHTWSTVESTTVTWHTDKMKENTSTLELKDKIVDMYNLTDIIIEEQQDRSDEFGFFVSDFSSLESPKQISIWGIKCLYHSITASYKLAQNYSIKNNVKYDYIAFIRPDILLYSEFDLEKFIFGLKSEEIYNSFFFSALVQRKTRINDIRMMHANDLIFFAVPNVIENMTNNFDTFLSKLYDGLLLKDLAVETLKLKLLENLGYTNYCIDYHMFKDFIILRENNVSQNNFNFIDNCTSKIIKSQISNFLMLLIIFLLSLFELDILHKNIFYTFSVFLLLGIVVLSFAYAYKLARKLFRLAKKCMNKILKNKK